MNLSQSKKVDEDRNFNTIPRGFFQETGNRMTFGDRINIWKENTDPAPLKGWSLRRGTAKFIQRVREEHDLYGKAIVIVSHGDVIAGVIGSAEGYPAWERWENCAVPVGSLSVIDMQREGPLYLHIKGYDPLDQ